MCLWCISFQSYKYLIYNLYSYDSQVHILYEDLPPLPNYFHICTIHLHPLMVYIINIQINQILLRGNARIRVRLDVIPRRHYINA